MSDGRRHVEEESLLVIFINEIEGALGNPFLIVHIQGIAAQLDEVCLVVACHVVEAEGPHPLTEHTVIMAHFGIGRGVRLRFGLLWISKQALRCPVIGVVEIVVREVALANETGAVACLLQPGTEILAVGFEFRIRDGEAPNRAEWIARDEALAGITRGPATGHQGIARGSTHGRRGKCLIEADAGPG